MVEARQCGACTVCCIVPGIDTPQIQKATGSVCRNCGDGGCAIYDVRPRACRDFTCAWLDGALGDDWRPDQSGVFAQAVTLQGRQGMSLMLVADAVKTARQGWFVDYVQRAVRDGVPLVLALPGPMSMRSAKTLLNDDEMRHAAAGSPEQVRQVLRTQVRALMDGDFETLTLLNTGNDVST
jgi:hypothetical protein